MVGRDDDDDEDYDSEDHRINTAKVPVKNSFSCNAVIYY